MDSVFIYLISPSGLAHFWGCTALMKRQQTLAFYFQVRFKNERITLLIRIFSPLHLKLIDLNEYAPSKNHK
jgi:hypothetical protein